jgi:hypothetical protein
VATKVCTVKGVDPRGLPKTATVEAHSLFEAAAQGFEKLHQNGGCRFDSVEITVHEPRATFQVRAGQLVNWLGRHGEGESIGVTALKRRVQELLQASDKRTTGRRGESGGRR